MHKIDAHTQLCAVIGNPVEHTLSPAMHNAAFVTLGLNYVYLAFRVEDVAGCMVGMRALSSFRGLSVTIPHKMAVIPFLDEIDTEAQFVGCVNTITKVKERLVGSATDGSGTLRAFAEAGVSLEGKRVLFLGSGGAVRAVAFAFAQYGKLKGLTILGRTFSKTQRLAEDISTRTGLNVVTGGLSKDLEALVPDQDIIVQGTPIGMYPNADDTCLPAELLHPNQVVFDMVYRPLKTRLIREAESKGCKTILGLEMLVHQATLQFEKWTGCAAPVDIMRQAALDVLKTQESTSPKAARDTISEPS